VTLPRSPEQLRGRRAARWLRESTAGQMAMYGPDSQRRLQDRAIAHLELVDSGLAWEPAQSGSTVYLGPAMAAMLDAARAGEFDVLVVAYVDRWQRNLRQTLNLLEDELHPAGVAVWFCDEEILSSNDRAWDQLVDRAKAAERAWRPSWPASGIPAAARRSASAATLRSWSSRIPRIDPRSTWYSPPRPRA